ncbi:HAD family hydrolase [Pseudoalteromonas carrageenovora]|uniref:HAD family hydrolase n=1 Tax=Pseudoalteromonas carrageenovora TaxID=227 RepID=UPI0026E2E296|nr:HAD family hydrolase [Pseudoalteromonas carrageenovora]MDO6548895.1 HAD family hydrolase [Pseudoalteromonas carrageenovora]MDO6833400.1 HAD family hydrolase [Pseudoalteromonas carrageenovora]
MESFTKNQTSAARFTAFGSTFMGPTLSFFSQQLVENTTQNTPLFFLSREGYWLEKAFKQFLLGSNKKQSSCYLLASRAFLFKLLLGNSQSYAYSLKGDFKGSFYDLMRTRFLLSNSEIEDIFSNEIRSRYVELTANKKSIIEVLANHKKAIDKVIAPTKCAYLSYLEAMGVNKQSTLHLVDLGYSGTIQALLSILLNKDTYGHYLIASNPGMHTIEGCKATMKGYLKEGVKIGEGYLPLDRSMFLESLLTAPNGQFRDIKLNIFDQSKFDFYYGRKVASQRYFYELEQIMAGALNYCFHTGKHQLAFTSHELELLLNSYMGKPNMIPKCTTHIFDIDDDVTGNGTVNALQFFGLA